MAMLKFGSAVVAEPSVDSGQWQKSVCCGHKAKCSCGTESCKVKVAKTVLAKYSPEKYLLSHCTIIGAVDVELADPKNPNSDYFIHPAYSSLVNNNGDAWSKKMLATCYKTFVGSNNYLEHVQIPELSKGKVIDAVLREVPVGKDKQGNDLTTYYVDILVATERKHKDLVAKIENGSMNSLSMGCKIAYSICTKCGNKAVDDSQACEHVRFEKNNMFFDDYGVQRKVAELCGHYNEPESVTFIDASWVANPAFTGAVIRNIVNPPENVMAKIEEANKKTPYLYEDGHYLKAAYHKDAAPKDPPAEDPPVEAPAEDPAVEDNAVPGEETAAPEDAATPDMGAAEPPLDQNSAESWKKKIKERLMRDLGDEIIKDLDGDEAGGMSDRELETLDDSLIHPTASTALKEMYKMKKSWDKYLHESLPTEDKKTFERLKFGTYMILTSNDLTALKDYGYSRRDFLAVMSFLDKCFKSPLSLGVKKAIAELDGTKGLDLDTTVYSLQKLAGRRLNDSEVERSITWLRAMDSYR